ncbi:MAG: hypothetical protein JSS87_02255 [Acidobacteria bacterium]|nr:hypothetical protein [Acidobacteriota bacterium]
MIDQYAYDVVFELRKNAIDIRRQIESSTEPDRTFLEGKLLAYNEVLSLIITQAHSFGIDPAAFGLVDFDPDRDL